MTDTEAAKPETDIAVIIENEPGKVLQDPALFASLCQKIKGDIAAHEYDLTTDKGRKAITAMAFKITRTKTAIDDAGKALTEGLRKQVGAVDAARRAARDTLDELRDKARAPLDNWQREEEQRLATVDKVMTDLRSARIVSSEDTVASIGSRLKRLADYEFNGDILREQLNDAEFLRDEAVKQLQASVVRLEREEADRAELQRLREAEAKRLREETERQAAEAEARRKQQEAEAERQRIAQAEKTAAEDARKAAIAKAEKKAQAEHARLEREHAAAMEKQHKELADARAAEAERQRIAAEDAERARDEAHRATVAKEAAKEIMKASGVDLSAASLIVGAIITGRIPHLFIKF